MCGHSSSDCSNMFLNPSSYFFIYCTFQLQNFFLVLFYIFSLLIIPLCVIERQAPIVTGYQESSPNNQLWPFLFAFLPYFPFLSSSSSIIVSNHLWRQHIIHLHSCLCRVDSLSQVPVLLTKSINILASLISLHSDFCSTNFIILYHFDLNFFIK